MTIITIIIGVIAFYYTYKTLFAFINTLVYNKTKGMYGVKTQYYDYLIISILLWGIFIYYLIIKQ